MASTSMNRESSRSHAVFTMTLESKETGQEVVNIRTCQLNLVDLAGSERQRDTHAEGSRLKVSTLKIYLSKYADLKQRRGLGLTETLINITFTFSRLADAFIQMSTMEAIKINKRAIICKCYNKSQLAITTTSSVVHIVLQT